jgi:transcriptional regulator with XRE-family HTH domain
MIRISKKKKKAGILPNHRVIAMVDYILDHRVYADQKQLAAAAGLTNTTISRMKSGAIKNPTMSSLIKINDACGGIFNMDYLRGRSNTMLAADAVTPTTDAASPAQPAVMPASNAELSSYVNSALASKDETIEALKSKLADLGTLVDELREQLAEKRRDKAELQDENCRLRKELSDVKLERDRLRAQLDADPLRHYPYPIGVAEPGSKSQVGTGDAAAVPTQSDAL